MDLQPDLPKDYYRRMKHGMTYYGVRFEQKPEERDPDRIKTIVSPTDYSKVETKEGGGLSILQTPWTNNEKTIICKFTLRVF